jgi:pimeloyl-ACP methyl ester carboxylesterase
MQSVARSVAPGNEDPPPKTAASAHALDGGWQHAGQNAWAAMRHQYRRQIRKTPEIRMIPGALRHGGRLLRFAISDNWGAHGPDGPDTPPIWAVNIHGYFAGGGMYWRESARLAERMGWRVVNPSLPGFGGSDPLEWQDITLPTLAEQVRVILRHLDAGPAVMLGHSMGGAVAIQYAHDYPSSMLGIIYRDGVATPSWKNRQGIIPVLLAPMGPEMATFADMISAVVLDVPDLFIGRMLSTMRSVLPDVRRNIRTMGRTLPVGSMLMTVDLRPQIRGLVAQRIPILNEWGCFDRVAPSATAVEFAEISRSPVQWVPGGHSWMLARPGGQSDVLTHLASGRRFVAEVNDRWRRITASDRSLRVVP